MFTRLIAYFFAALFFFVPLVLWPKTYEVFEFNKILLVYILAGAITTLWAARCIVEKRLIFRHTLLDKILLLFLASQLLSTFASIDPHTSVWGYYSRFHGGLASTIAYLLLYFALVSNLDHRHLPLLLYSLLSSATLISLYAVAEHFGIDKDLWVQDVQNRVFSTLGQPNWLSAYLLALVPLPIFFALKTKDTLIKLLYTFLTLLFLISIWFTKSQSGIGATVIILTLIPIYLLGQKNRLVYLVLPLLIAVGFFLRPSFFYRINPLGLTRVDQLVEADLDGRVGGSDSMVIRQVVWKGALDLFRRRPLLGTGVETFGYSYYWTRPAAHNLLSEWDFLYNKAHNEYLNFLATTGILGLGSYLILIGFIIYLFIKHLKKSASADPFPHLTDALLFGFISILITNYFGFSVVPVALFFFLYPALSLLTTIKPEPAVKPTRLDYTQIAVLAVLALLFLSWFVTIFRRWQADIAFNHGKVLNEAGYVGAALPKLEKAAQMYPQEPLFRDILAESYANAALAVHQQLAKLPQGTTQDTAAPYLSQRSQFIQQSTDTINQVIKDNPYHLNYLKSRAKIELTLSQIDPSFIQSALITLLSANELAPTDAKILFNIGLLNLELNQIDSAKLAFTKAIELKKDYFQARQYLDQVNSL